MSAPTLAPRPGLPVLEPVIEDHEIVPLLQALGDGQGSFSIDEAMILTKWATRARCSAILLDLALSGQVMIELADDGEPIFTRRPGRRS